MADNQERNALPNQPHPSRALPGIRAQTSLDTGRVYNSTVSESMRSWRDDTGERVEEGGEVTASRTDPDGTTIIEQRPIKL